ncbi:MAG: hypothetical protein JW765_05530 [Deltaproteobacteria bacterium]|nr:hypothetical protein [Candidatus Zymogenaceae bacterium]
MKARIGYGKEDPIIPERAPVCHDCPASDGRPSLIKDGPVSGTAGGALPPPFPRPPRAAGFVTCRGCFNRCELAPGEPGICTVKRNIGGRITGFSLRVKRIVPGS